MRSVFKIALMFFFLALTNTYANTYYSILSKQICNNEGYIECFLDTKTKVEKLYKKYEKEINIISATATLQDVIEKTYTLFNEDNQKNEYEC